MSRKSIADIGAISPAGTVIEVLSATGANRAVRVAFKCAHCGEIGRTRWTKFASANGNDRARSCRCLKKKHVAKMMDLAIGSLGSEQREVIAQEAEAAGLGAGMALAIEFGATCNVWLRYAISNLRRQWAASFVSTLSVIERTKFWLIATRKGVRAAAAAMGWNRAQAIAAFRAIKRATASITEAAQKAAHIASYRIQNLVSVQGEYPASVYGSKARKDVCIKWALHEISGQVVTDEIGLKALLKEKRTNILRMNRRQRFIEKLRAGLVESYEQIAFKITNRVSCWPSRFTHETLALAAA